MAKATTLIEKRELSQAEQDAQALGEILGAVAQHKEGLLAFLDIVNEMHQAGLLDLARGVLKSRQQIGVLGINQLNKSGAQRTIKNGVSALQFIGKLDPAKVSQLLDAVVRGMEHAHPSDQKISMWGMMGTLRDPDVNASLTTMMNFLRGMGQGMTQVH